MKYIDGKPEYTGIVVSITLYIIFKYRLKRFLSILNVDLISFHRITPLEFDSTVLALLVPGVYAMFRNTFNKEFIEPKRLLCVLNINKMSSFIELILKVIKLHFLVD